MHGLVNRAIQVFVRDTYGADAWAALMRTLDLGIENFESMLSYDDKISFQMVDAACAQLGRDRGAFLAALGTYLVSHENVGALRRLLRFGGDTFLEFLYSLDELGDRVRIAVPELALPPISVSKSAPTEYRIKVDRGLDGFVHVLVGVLRAMADDFGALVLLDYENAEAPQPVVVVTLLDLQFSEGRDFVLGAQL